MVVAGLVRVVRHSHHQAHESIPYSQLYLYSPIIHLDHCVKSNLTYPVHTQYKQVLLVLFIHRQLFNLLENALTCPDVLDLLDGTLSCYYILLLLL